MAQLSISDGDDARILACTVPLLWPQQGRAPTLVATAVALRVADCLFLLTAAHAVDQFLVRSFLVAHRNAFHGFSCRAERNVTVRRERENDPVDVAILHVDYGELPTLYEDALTPRDLALREWQRPVGDVYLAGYPQSRYRALVGDRTAKYDAFRLSATRAAAAALVAVARDPLTHVGLDFDPKDVIRHGSRVRPPRLVGVSGGGIWAVPLLHDPSSLSGPKLLAIFTDHMADRKLLVGTRVSSHCEVIRAICPHLSSPFRALGNSRRVGDPTSV